MQVDTYSSRTKPQYSLVVKTGTDLDSFTDDIKNVIDKLKPFIAKSNVALDSFCTGDLLKHHVNELASKGASLQKTSVSFDEIL